MYPEVLPKNTHNFSYTKKASYRENKKSYDGPKGLAIKGLIILALNNFS